MPKVTPKCHKPAFQRSKSREGGTRNAPSPSVPPFQTQGVERGTAWPAAKRDRNPRSPPRRLGRELRAAHAHAPARVLPQLLGGVQVAKRPRHGAEVMRGKAL